MISYQILGCTWWPFFVGLQSTVYHLCKKDQQGKFQSQVQGLRIALYSFKKIPCDWLGSILLRSPRLKFVLETVCAVFMELQKIIYSDSQVTGASLERNGRLCLVIIHTVLL